MKHWVKKTIGPVILGAMIVAAFTTGGSAGTARPRGLVADMQDATGASVGKIRFIPKDDGKVIVKARVSGLTPGFHGFHVHTAGACDPDAQDTAGATVPFFTAGGHYNPVTTNSHGLHAGDMPPLLVTDDGSAVLRLATDRFRNRDLLDEDGSAVIIHAGPDNLAHVPATTPAGGERYHSHVDDVFGPDTATRATGDAGARFACGVVTKAPR
ncbi:MAG: superoxide dismutase family protein [Actinomycetota bacterium]